MPTLRIAAISLASDPAARSANLARIEQWSLAALSQGAQLVCLPAMAVTGFWRSSEVCHHAEIIKTDLINPALGHPQGPSVQRLAQFTRRHPLQLAAGIIEDLDFYHLRNSVAVFQAGEHLGAAAEIHTPLTPHATFAGALECPVFQMSGYTMGIVVGDDLYHPEVARMLAIQGAQVLIVALATPHAEEAGTIAVWREQIAQLLAVRALENGVSIVAVDAAGSIAHPVEDLKAQFSGQALAFDPRGQLLAQTPPNHAEKMLLVDVPLPAAPTDRLARRRPFLYQPLVAEKKRPDIPGTREADWDAQGEILWSRLRDFGFFGADLCSGRAVEHEGQNTALVVTGPSLPPLRPYRAVVLARPCLARLSQSDAARLADWVTAGGTLVLDGYDGRHAETLGPLTGLRGGLRPDVYLPSYEDASRVTIRLRSAGEHAVFTGMDLQHAPKVWGQVWLPESENQVTARPLAHFITADQQVLGPGLYENPVGQGRVYTFTYSLGYSQLLLMQGRGTTVDIGSFPERISATGPARDGDVSMWGDQVVTDSPDQYFPSADYHLIPLLNMLIGSVGAHVLVSPVPEGRECGVIFSGDSDRAGAALINEYTEMLARHGIRPTQFILRGGYDARELNAECEYGIHPLFHETEQACMDVLVSYGFDRTKLICGRRHCLIQYGLTDTLERMAACGVRFTSNNWDFPYPETLSTAFLYGTALPHRIYDWQGSRVGIVDIPQVFMDYPPFLETTQAAYADVLRTHGVGAWNFHPQNLVIPGMKEAIEWLAVQVRRDDVWSGTMGAYGVWYEQRERTQIRCTGEEVTLDGEPPEGLTLLSPTRDLNINGHSSRADRFSTWYGRPYWVHCVRPAARVPRATQLTT